MQLSVCLNVPMMEPVLSLEFAPAQMHGRGTGAHKVNSVSFIAAIWEIQ